jgi:hypothetical protein
MAIRPRKPKRRPGPVVGPRPRQKTKIGKTIKPKPKVPSFKSFGLKSSDEIKAVIEMLKKQLK